MDTESGATEVHPDGGNAWHGVSAADIDAKSDSPQPSFRKRHRVFVTLVPVVAIALGGVGVFIAVRSDAPSVKVSLIIVDSTSENHVPASASVRVPGSPDALLEFRGKRTEPILVGTLHPGERSNITVHLDGPSKDPVHVDVRLKQSKTYPNGGRVVVEVSDDNVAISSDIPGTSSENVTRRNPVAVARRKAAAEFAQQVSIMRFSLDAADAAWSEAQDRYDAIFGSDRRAAFSEVLNGIDNLVQPKLDQAASALTDIGITLPEVRAVFDKYSEALRLMNLATLQERNSAANYVEDPSVSKTYSDAGAGRRQALSMLHALEGKTTEPDSY